MFDSIWEDIKHEFRQGNSITRIITINAGVFLLINMVHVILFLVNSNNPNPDVYQKLIHLLSVPSAPEKLILQPWSLFTHMFLHTGFFHLLFNMLYLYWFGRIYADLIGDRFIWPTYLFSGLIGVVFFMLSSYLFLDGALAYAMGASAAVLGITMAAAAIAPNYTINLLLIGPVKLKYIALVLVLLDVFFLPTMTNIGGHFGHIGGALGGLIFVSLIKNGFDPNSYKSDQFLKRNNKKSPRNVFDITSSVSKKKEKEDKNQVSDTEFEKKLNRILEKIKSKGKASLTEEEKEFLEEASKQT